MCRGPKWRLRLLRSAPRESFPRMSCNREGDLPSERRGVYQRGSSKALSARPTISGLRPLPAENRSAAAAHDALALQIDFRRAAALFRSAPAFRGIFSCADILLARP